MCLTHLRKTLKNDFYNKQCRLVAVENWLSNYKKRENKKEISDWRCVKIIVKEKKQWIFTSVIYQPEYFDYTVSILMCYFGQFGNISIMKNHRC